jgi:hypothetical protein
MATKPRARKPSARKAPAAKPAAAKPAAAKPPAEKSEESSSASSRWQEARAIGMNFGNYLQIEKQVAAGTPRAAAETEAVTESYRRGIIWA